VTSAPVIDFGPFGFCDNPAASASMPHARTAFCQNWRPAEPQPEGATDRECRHSFRTEIARGGVAFLVDGREVCHVTSDEIRAAVPRVQP
jgi:hypothetical protein